MSDSINLAFLWHMHQPWYLDPSSGQQVLPWVRLHATAAYTDMADLLARHPGIHATVTFSPSLLDQLGFYLEGGQDTFELITRCPAAELTSSQRAFLVRHFFSAHWGRVLPDFPRYQELLDRRGHQVGADGWEGAAARLSVDDLRDLQVLFNLAWIGPTSRSDPAIARLVEAGRSFSEDDKQVVLNLQRGLLEQLARRWKQLYHQGSVDIGCCAYYHGILPLLIDSNTAKRANPQVMLPDRFSFPDDARTQILRGVDRIEREFGERPEGLWLPEGAVSPEVARLASECGLRFIVADNDLLFHSLDDRGSTPGVDRQGQVYSHGGCAVVFRNNKLSNMVATEYARWDDSAAAAADLIQRVERLGDIAITSDDAPPLVVVALNGENPWEAYPRQGIDFLSSLYEQLERSSRIRTVTIREHLDAHPRATALDFLHSGSGIEANFDIWIGDPDKNRAWSLLLRARDRLARAERGQEQDAESLRLAREHLLRAECSDWFWWLGEPFSSVEEDLFEFLFREHLVAMYRELEDNPPADLSREIKAGGIVEPLRQPARQISPRVDGTRMAFFEWRGAGFYRVPAGGSMFQEHSFISGIYWGFDAGRLFIRLDPVEVKREASSFVEPDLELLIEFTAPNRAITARLELSPALRLSLACRAEGGELTELGSVEQVAFKEVVEMAIPLARLEFSPGARVGLTVHFVKSGTQIAVIPWKGVIEIELPHPG